MTRLYAFVAQITLPRVIGSRLPFGTAQDSKPVEGQAPPTASDNAVAQVNSRQNNDLRGLVLRGHGELDILQVAYLGKGIENHRRAVVHLA
jgi:hypothetical protein